MEAKWTEVDEYFAERLAPQDAALEQALADSTAAALPPISVTATQGKFLAMLAEVCHARRILEIGTLGGYSTIWMARALAADGTLVTLEIDARHADVAQKNIDRAGLADRVQVIVAPAAESLAQLKADGVAPFDLVFIDADKQSSDTYFEAALALSHVGTLIVVDNVVRDGEVTNAASTDASILGIRRLTELLAREPRVSSTAIQTVGSKGYDGFVLARVVA
ncbi:MAG: O-methyltransferase [Cytophagaceae bacterium]|nr:O-methyltransferase [Gemmatimonadaceae bacterium]